MLIRPPDKVLPAPERRELPTPLRLSRMLGPGVILVGLSLGSGEFVLWPYLTANWGFAVFWACLVGVTIHRSVHSTITLQRRVSCPPVSRVTHR